MVEGRHAEMSVFRCLPLLRMSAASSDLRSPSISFRVSDIWEGNAKESTMESRSRLLVCFMCDIFGKQANSIGVN